MSDGIQYEAVDSFALMSTLAGNSVLLGQKWLLCKLVKSVLGAAADSELVIVNTASYRSLILCDVYQNTITGEISYAPVKVADVLEVDRNGVVVEVKR